MPLDLGIVKFSLRKVQFTPRMTSLARAAVFSAVTLAADIIPPSVAISQQASGSAATPPITGCNAASISTVTGPNHSAGGRSQTVLRIEPKASPAGLDHEEHNLQQAAFVGPTAGSRRGGTWIAAEKAAGGSPACWRKVCFLRHELQFRNSACMQAYRRLVASAV
jgi:hypothetical protein